MNLGGYKSLRNRQVDHSRCEVVRTSPIMVCKVVFAALCSVLLVPALAAPSSRIVGGWEAEENQFPHQISLRRLGSHSCGGSIISEDIIVTAAHCVVDASGRPNPTSTYIVVAGSNSLRQGGVSVKVSKIVVHESYGNFLNDIALLKLAEPLKFDDSVQPIEVYNGEVPEGSDIIISGWGRIYHGGPLSNNLKFNILTAISQEECSRKIGMNYAGLICLGHSRDNGACNGDSGGPATYQGKLVGVANFVYGGCGNQYPDGYAKVAYFTKWIKNNTP